MFNYLITIHNQERLLEEVLAGVARCAGAHSRIIPVLDGCTDGSEAIVKRFARESGIETRILTAPDVHEIRSINIGLRECGPGFVVILQDDVILEQADLEEKVQALRESCRCRLGYVSFRLAADVGPTALHRRARLALRFGRHALSQLVYDYNHIAAPGESLDVPSAQYGEFHARMVGIKSPVCITPELREREPLLDESLAPYCYDDVDMSLRALKHGLVNGLYALRFRSEPEWGGTRKDPAFSASPGARIRLRNRAIVWRKHADLIRRWNGAGRDAA